MPNKFTIVNKTWNNLLVGEITPCRKSGRYRGTSIGRMKSGYFVCTHRARSKTYLTPRKIPLKTIAWIKSTG